MAPEPGSRGFFGTPRDPEPARDGQGRNAPSVVALPEGCEPDDPSPLATRRPTWRQRTPGFVEVDV